LLFSAGHLVIDLFFDDRYLAAGHIMEILAVGLFEVRYSLANQCFMAMGLPKLMVPSSLVRLIVLFGVMPAAYELFGLDGALWTITGSLLLTVPVVIYLSVRYGIFELKRELLVLPFLGIGYFIGITITQGAAFVSAS
jgi:O-antigen/teichoic acid export membrane protein